jgi:hypothetical protein
MRRAGRRSLSELPGKGYPSAGLIEGDFVQPMIGDDRGVEAAGALWVRVAKSGDRATGGDEMIVVNDSPGEEAVTCEILVAVTDVRALVLPDGFRLGA